jgi:hypothetical protein
MEIPDKFDFGGVYAQAVSGTFLRFPSACVQLFRCRTATSDHVAQCRYTGVTGHSSVTS